MLTITINEIAYDKLREETKTLANGYLQSHSDKSHMRDDIEVYIEEVIVQSVIKTVINLRFGHKHIVVERDGWLNQYLKSQLPHIKREAYSELDKWL